MKKEILLILTLFLAIISFLLYNLYNYRAKTNEAKKDNSSFESFYNVEVLGTDIASLINKVADYNNKNKIEKDKNGMTIENDSNSVKLDIKFLELDDPISYEKIENQGINQFVQNFSGFSFKCTKIEYHEKTGKVKYMYFEQVEEN